MTGKLEGKRLLKNLLCLLYLLAWVYANKAKGQETRAPSLILEAKASCASVYQGTPVRVDLILYYTQLPQKIRYSKEPKLKGFWKKDIPLGQITAPVLRDGIEYTQKVIRAFWLIPLKAGFSEIEPFILEGVWQFQQKSSTQMGNNAIYLTDKVVTLKTQAIRLEVKPLPEPKPASFVGAVGEFLFSYDCRPLKLTQQERASLKLRVRGEGNLPMLSLPEIQFQPTDLEVFKELETDNINYSDNIRIEGSRTFSYELIPNKYGKIALGKAKFCFFSPSQKRYIEQTLTLPTLDVVAGEYKETKNALGAVDSASVKGPDSLGSTGQNKLSIWHWFTIGAILIIIAIVAYLIRGARNSDSLYSKNEIVRRWLIFLQNRLLALEQAYNAREQVSHEELLRQFRFDIRRKLTHIMNLTSNESEKELLGRFAKLYFKETNPLFRELQLALLELLALEFIPYTDFSDFTIKTDKLYKAIERLRAEWA
jgi:hypothetical protein